MLKETSDSGKTVSISRVFDCQITTDVEYLSNEKVPRSFQHSVNRKSAVIHRKFNTVTFHQMVSIIMGSDSDLGIMRQAADVLQTLEVPFEVTIVSAHRTPERMFDFAKNAHKRGVKVIIAGAGGAAHLPGMVASLSPLPVIGVPVKSSNSLDGWDSILSILQMPNGVPVATVALNAAKNAGILAAQILATSNEALLDRVIAFKQELTDSVALKYEQLERVGYEHFLQQKKGV
jgi:5-(carboxyamino)imidazole ribonucleotide mutase